MYYASESYQSESESLVNKDVEGPDPSGGSGRLSHQDLGWSPIHYRGLSPLFTFVCSSTSASYVLQAAHASCTSITCWKYFSSSIMIDVKYFTIIVIRVRWDYCHHDETNSRHPLDLVIFLPSTHNQEYLLGTIEWEILSWLLGIQVRTVLLLKSHVLGNWYCMAKTICVDWLYDSTLCLSFTHFSCASYPFHIPFCIPVLRLSQLPSIESIDSTYV